MFFPKTHFKVAIDLLGSSPVLEKKTLRVHPYLSNDHLVLVCWTKCNNTHGKQNKHKDVYALIPRSCEYVVLHGKRDFVDMIVLRILR